MKGKCDLIKCMICKEQMSFSRIQRHIKIQHSETWENYKNKFWQTLPLHYLCKVCYKNIVYKYKTCSPECRNIQQSQSTKGKSKPKGFMSKEHIEKISKSHEGKIISIETSLKISRASKGISRNKGQTPMLGKKHSEETKEKQSIKRKEYYINNPKIVDIFVSGKMNKLEKLVSFILDSNNIEYNFQFFLKTKENICKSYDFRIKDTNILIEIDGDYYHGNPRLKKHFFKLEEVRKNDLIKDQLAQDNGYTLLRFWESEIYENPNIIINKINEQL